MNKFHVKLGSSDLSVSRLCLGTMMFADQTDESEAKKIVDHALEHDVNFLDTADVYAKGGSESMLGKLVHGRRNRFLIASKLGNPMSALPNEGGYSRVWMQQAINNSLERLNTEHLDVYYMHRDKPGLNLCEPIAMMGELITQGKIRYWGLSNFRGWRIAQAVETARAMGVPAPIVCQPYYNLLNRQPEVEILPACKAYGVAIVPYSPIARGVLTGKYQPGHQPSSGTRAARADKRMMETEFRENSLVIAQQLRERAAQLGVDLQHYACAWVLKNQLVSAIIAGPRTFAQWQDYFACLEVPLDQTDETLVDQLVAPGYASTLGYHDPAYPFVGRTIE
jgi:aryl-alcohol dehydrogenase-like predicted oxidoreductase